MNKIKTVNLTNEIGFGLSSWATVFTYAVCMSAALGQGLIAVLGISIVCALCSLKLKETVFAPCPVFAVPLLYISADGVSLLTTASVILGVLMFTVEKKLIPDFKLPPRIKAFCFIIIAVCGTILLTNIYFGIGIESVGSPVYMLKAYKSSGFHPHFMGLLTGTITLFMMITYPFKFRKLNKYLPAEFISLTVPFVINLILNPIAENTAINESIGLTPVSFADFDFQTLINKNDFGVSDIAGVIIGAILLNIIFIVVFADDYGCTLNAKAIIPAAFFGSVIKEKQVRGNSVVSVAVIAFLSIAAVFFLPQMLSRIPLHSIGALLIVSLWQQVPFGNFKRRGLK